MSEKTRNIPEGTFFRVLDEAIGVLERAGVPYALIGGIASAALGRPGWSPDGEDIDFFVRPQDARDVLNALGEAGYATGEAEPDWLYKAFKRDVLVDVIFKSSGDIRLDEEMTARVRLERVEGRQLRVPSPEDFVVMKAVGNSEETPGYWHEALSVMGRHELDWLYLLRRARRHGARRVLSLLLYAQSVDLAVPRDVVRDLFGAIEVESASWGSPYRSTGAPTREPYSVQEPS